LAPAKLVHIKGRFSRRLQEEFLLL